MMRDLGLNAGLPMRVGVSGRVYLSILERLDYLHV